MARDKDDLWRNFPKTAIEFDRRFATEEACRAYWIEARWGGEPACARCGSKRVWAERGGFLFECADCDHQTSLTSGTLLEKTRKAVQGFVPGGVRDLLPAQWHLGQGAAADLRLRLLQDGVELAAQAQGGAGAPGARAARPSRSNR